MENEHFVPFHPKFTSLRGRFISSFPQWRLLYCSEQRNQMQSKESRQKPNSLKAWYQTEKKRKWATIVQDLRLCILLSKIEIIKTMYFPLQIVWEQLPLGDRIVDSAWIKNRRSLTAQTSAKMANVMIWWSSFYVRLMSKGNPDEILSRNDPTPSLEGVE